MKLTVVCISDTHGAHEELDLPSGDILIHAGDFTNQGTANQIIEFNKWLGSVAFQYQQVLVIAGNHERAFKYPEVMAEQLITAGHLLTPKNRYSILTVGDNYALRVAGSPYTPLYGYNWAYNYERGHAEEIWNPYRNYKAEILITHGPPFGILDQPAKSHLKIPGGDFADTHGMHVGCEELLDIAYLIQPKLHVFGHIHEGYGQVERDGIKFVNASIWDHRTDKLNKPIVVEIDI